MSFVCNSRALELFKLPQNEPWSWNRSFGRRSTFHIEVDIYQIDKKHIYMLEFTTSVQLHSDHNRWQPHWKDNAIIHFQQGV